MRRSTPQVARDAELDLLRRAQLALLGLQLEPHGTVQLIKALLRRASPDGQIERQVVVKKVINRRGKEPSCCNAQQVGHPVEGHNAADQAKCVAVDLV